MRIASSLDELIQDMIDDEIATLRDLNGETKDTEEENCLGPEEVYRCAKQNVRESLAQAIEKL